MEASESCKKAMQTEHDVAIAAKARDEVLDELAIKIREWPALEKGIDEEWRVGNIISSLRSEVKKE